MSDPGAVRKIGNNEMMSIRRSVKTQEDKNKVKETGNKQQTLERKRKEDSIRNHDLWSDLVFLYS